MSPMESYQPLPSMIFLTFERRNDYNTLPMLRRMNTTPLSLRPLSRAIKGKAVACRQRTTQG